MPVSRRAARHSSRPHGFPAARATDMFYDTRGREGHFRECHDTAAVIFIMKNENTGTEANIYQGGAYPAKNRSFLINKQHPAGRQLHLQH